MIWRRSAWINRWLTRSLYLEYMVAVDGERNFIIKSTYLYLLKRCNLEIFWYNNVGENIFQIIFLQYCINARLSSLELRHGMEDKRTEISYLDWSEWEWKESVIVPIHKKGDKTECNNYRGISLLPTTYKILSNILLSRLIPYAEEIMGDYQCGFRRSGSTTDHIFCIR
jgi:hypothetical protein